MRPFSFSMRPLLRDSLYRRDVEGTERDIDNTVRAKDDDESDNAPEDGALALLALALIPRPFDELEHAPEEEDERGGREKQDNRINNLHDDLP